MASQGVKLYPKGGGYHPPTPQAVKDEVIRLMVEERYFMTGAMRKVGVSIMEIYDWCREDPEYGARYKAAQKILSHHLAAESVTDLENANIEQVDAKVAMAVVSKLGHQARAKQWAASRINPDDYGDRVEHKHDVAHRTVVLLPALARLDDAETQEIQATTTIPSPLHATNDSERPQPMLAPGPVVEGEGG